MKLKPYFTAALLVGVLGTIQPLSASDRVWNSSGTSAFFSGPGNGWNTAVPGPADTANFNFATSATFTVTMVASATNQYMRLNGAGPLTVNLDLAGFNYVATDSGGTQDNTTSIARGSNANNTLNILGSGTFSSNGIFISGNASATGKVTVSGAGTVLSVSGTDTVIGSAGSGTLEVTNKASFITAGSTGVTRIGRNNAASSVGTVVIDDATWTASNETQVGSAQVGSSTSASSGHLIVQNGGKVFLTESGTSGWLSFGAANNSATGLITGAGSEVSTASTVAIGGRGNSAATAGTVNVTVENGGKLVTTGTLNLFETGTLAVADGLVSAGRLGSGSALAAGKIEFTLSGTNALMDITGNVNLDSTKAALELSLLTGTTYNVGDVIHLINYGGTLSGAFFGITNGQELSFGGYDFEFSYGTGSNSFMSLTVVPEPSTAALLGMVALATLTARKRRK